MKSYRNNWVNYSEIVEIPSNMADSAVLYALERAVGDRGNKVFELSNHLGNVLATVSDKKLGRVLDNTSFVAAYYEGQVRSAQDYYAFGWNIPSRKFNTGSYRHGFNGKENDSDFGEQLIQDYGFRIYNPSVGRFLSVDPLKRDYPWYTPYQFAGNKPIENIDIDGLEEWSIKNSETSNDAFLTLVRVEGNLKFTKNGLVIPMGSSERKMLEDYYKGLNFYVRGKYMYSKEKISPNSLDPRLSDIDRARGYTERRVGVYADIPNSSDPLTYKPTAGIRVPFKIDDVEYEGIAEIPLNTISINTNINSLQAPVLNLEMPKPSPNKPITLGLSFVNPAPESGISVLGSMQPGWTNSSITSRAGLSEVSSIVSQQVDKLRAGDNRVTSMTIFKGAGSGTPSAASVNRANTLFKVTQKRLQSDNPKIPVKVKDMPAGTYGPPSIQVNSVPVN